MGRVNGAEERVLALAAYAHLPLLVNEQGKKLSKRRDPVAVEMYRERGYLPAAFRNYLALLGWNPGGEEIVPLETIIERFRLEDVQRSPAFFDIKKLDHFNGVYIRALSVDGFVEAARPWVDPVPGAWAPGGWLDPNTGAPVVAPVPWPSERFDLATFAALAAVTQERVATLGEVPALVDFLFLEDAPEGRGQLGEGDRRRRAGAGDPGRHAGGLRELPVGQGLAPRGDARPGGVGGPQARQGPGAHPGGRHGPDGGAAAVRLAGRAGPRRDAPAHRGGAGAAGRGRLMLLAPLRWALRIVLLVVAALVLYFAVTLVQVWLTSRQYNPRPAGAILVMGAAQYNCTPSPDLAARLDQALTLYHQGYTHLIMVTGNKEPGDRCTEAQSGALYLESKGVPPQDILQAGGDDSYENIADAAPALERHGAKVVLVTTDAFHEDRSMAIASDLSLTPSATPTQSSPIRGWSTVPYFLKETVGVGLGRIIGYNHLEWLHDA